MKLESTPKRQANYNAMHQDYCKACGSVMDIANFIEMMLSKFIFKHIGGVAENEIEELSFEEKKVRFIDFKEDGKLEQFNAYSRIIDDLNKIQYIRNAFGHGTLWTSKELLNNYNGDYFILIKFKPNKGLEEFRINLKIAKENYDKKVFYIDKLIFRANRFKNWISPHVMD